MSWKVNPPRPSKFGEFCSLNFTGITRPSEVRNLAGHGSAALWVPDHAQPRFSSSGYLRLISSTFWAVDRWCFNPTSQTFVLITIMEDQSGDKFVQVIADGQ